MQLSSDLDFAMGGTVEATATHYIGEVCGCSHPFCLCADDPLADLFARAQSPSGGELHIEYRNGQRVSHDGSDVSTFIEPTAVELAVMRHAAAFFARKARVIGTDDHWGQRSWLRDRFEETR